MKRFRKHLIITLIFAFVLSFAGLGFAAPADVVGLDCEDAVARLVALGVITGYEDGTFRPANSITRAEFAAVAVRTLGLETAAQFAKGATAFPDVAATHWASGYINVAVNNGIIEGYPDGTFKPEANVTYAEASAMVVRVLGYGIDVVGAWPTNYISKAASLGLYAGVSITDPNAPAPRCVVALLADNALDVKPLERVGFGDSAEYKVAAKTLLEMKHDVVKVAGVVVTDVPKLGNIKWGKVTVGGTTYDASIYVDGFLGQTVDALIHKGKTVIGIEVKSAVYSDKVAGTDYYPYEVKLNKLNKWYDIADGAQIFVNYQPASFWSLANNATGNFVIKDGKVTVVDIVYGLDRLSPGLVTSLANNRITTAGGGMAALLKTNAADYTFVKNGVKIAYEDIAKFDVLYKFGSYIEVFSNSVSGTVTRVAPVSGGYNFTVDGKAYKVYADNTTYRDSDTNAWGNFVDDDGYDFIDEEVTLYLERNGEVRHIDAFGLTLGAGKYGVVVNAAVDIGWDVKMRIFTTDGETVEYVVTGTDTIADARGLAPKDLVEYSLDSRGRISELTVVTYASRISDYKVNKNLDKIVFDGTTPLLDPPPADYFIKAGTIIFDATATAASSAKLTSWAALSHNSTITVQYMTTGSFVDVMVITASSTTTTTEKSGMIVAKYKAGTKWFVEINEKGTVNTYEATEAAFNAATAKKFVEYTTDAAAKITDFVDPDFAAYDYIDEINSSESMINVDGVWFRVPASAVVYDQDYRTDIFDFSALMLEMDVKVYVNDKDVVLAVIIMRP